MAAILAGVLPVFLMIALGYGLRKSGFLPDAAWRPIEKLAINVLYPGFLIPAIWNADLSGSAAGAAGTAGIARPLQSSGRSGGASAYRPSASSGGGSTRCLKLASA